MEFIQVLLERDYLLSMLMAIAVIFQYRERIQDKEYYRAQEKEFIRHIDALSDAIIAIKEAIKR